MQHDQVDKKIEPAVILGEEVFSNAHLCLKSTVLKVGAKTIDKAIEVNTKYKICVQIYHSVQRIHAE